MTWLRVAGWALLAFAPSVIALAIALGGWRLNREAQNGDQP